MKFIKDIVCTLYKQPLLFLAAIVMATIFNIAMFYNNEMSSKPSGATPDNWADNAGTYKSLVSNEKLSKAVSTLMSKAEVPNGTNANYISYGSVKKAYFYCDAWEQYNRFGPSTTMYDLYAAIITMDGVRHAFSARYAQNLCKNATAFSHATVVRDDDTASLDPHWTVSVPNSAYSAIYSEKQPQEIFIRLGKVLDVVNKSNGLNQKLVPDEINVNQTDQQDEIHASWQ
jgi:hypothetical protein